MLFDDFGDLTTGRSSGFSASDGTRGIYAGGITGTNPDTTETKTIEYITISAKGNSTNFYRFNWNFS